MVSIHDGGFERTRKYDPTENLKVLEGILDIAGRYERAFPELWGVYDLPNSRDKGLSFISACKNMDASRASAFVEIRREGDGSLKFYDYFDGEERKSSPERIAEKLGKVNAVGWSSPEMFTPRYLAATFRSAIEKKVGTITDLKLLGIGGLESSLFGTEARV